MSCQKHLGMHLDEKLNSNTHIKEKIAKANKDIGMICKLAHVLPRESLVTIYKLFVRPHIGYGDIIYDQPNNDSFCDIIERVQYNAALAITGAIKGTSQLKLYKGLGFESLKCRRWFRGLCFLYKLRTTQLPKYLYDLIPQESCTKDAVTSIMEDVDVVIQSGDIEACHRIGKSDQETSRKKTIVRFINCKYCKKALVNRKNFININSEMKYNFSRNNKIFINKNLLT